ncbi:hypothetical protein FRC12_022500 [Ceratobasidium sp. 428]|nr:hypothetical protein FRC12_022500 [Ceratobasidium sp. 428]
MTLGGASDLSNPSRASILCPGIDFTCPAIIKELGPGNKAAGGYQFAGDAHVGKYESVGKPGNVSDNDFSSLDERNRHGTHAVGITGTNSPKPSNVSNAAYEPTLKAHHVVGYSSSASDTITIEGLLYAYHDENDIVTLSLGGAEEWSGGASAVVASRIVRNIQITIDFTSGPSDSILLRSPAQPLRRLTSPYFYLQHNLCTQASQPASGLYAQPDLLYPNLSWDVLVCSGNGEPRGEGYEFRFIYNDDGGLEWDCGWELPLRLFFS